MHSQMLRRRRESNKDGAFALTCFLFLQDTWPWLLCATKCCAGAESPTKMALLNLHVFYFCRTRGLGFCALPNAAQAQRVGQNSLGQSVQRVHLPQLDSCRRDDTMPALKKTGSFTACRVYSDMTRTTFFKSLQCFDALYKIILLYYFILTKTTNNISHVIQ